MTIRQILNQLSNEAINEKDAAKKKVLLDRIKTFTNGAGIVYQNGKWTAKNGSNLDKEFDKVDPVTRDMLTKTTGWTSKGKVQTEKEKEAKQSFVNSDQSKVTPEVVAKQESNITKFDNATAAGQGRNTSAAKAAQEAQRDSRKLVNEVKQEGVADIPVTDDRSDAYYEQGINGSTGTDILPENEQPQEATLGAGETQPEESTGTGTNKYLLADMLFTALKNAAGYRPSHRTAYGQSYDGQAGGAEKSLAQKMAEENFKRGLERRNARADKRAQTEEEMRAAQTKAHNQDYVQSANELSKIGATQTQSGSSSSSNLLGSTSGSYSNTSFVNPTGLKGPAQVQQSN